MSPGRLVSYALGTVWLLGALMQIEMTGSGLGYEHGYVFAGIMGVGALSLFLLPTLLRSR